jgi:hypothetical protein
MTLNYGVDSGGGQISDEFMKGIKEFNYKSLVLVNYNSAKAVLIATAQHNFSKEMVAGCYLAVDTLAHMITPYIPILDQTKDMRDNINNLLQTLKEEYSKIYTSDRIERAEYVMKCEQVIVLLTANLSRVGIGATVKATGTFSYDQIISNRMKEIREAKKLKNK